MVADKRDDPPYCPMPFNKVPVHFALEYWTALYEANLLSDRLCDIKNPTIQDVHELWKLHAQHMYHMFDNERKCITAEFCFTGFTGKAAQIHFSAHPDNAPQYSMRMARIITNQVLHEWADSDDLSRPYLFALYGLTPTPNRAACAFVQRVGFKNMGILPMGQRYQGEPVDALITLKTREDHGR